MPGQKYNKSKGKYGGQLGRWFNNLIERLGFKTGGPALTMHSTRHTGITALINKDVDDHLIKALAGHSEAGVTRGVYHKGYEIEKLSRVINML